MPHVMKEARSGVSTSTTASLAAESSDAMSARAGDDDGDRERFLREEMPCSLWCCSAHCSKDLVPQVSAVPRVPSRDICLGLADLTNIQPNFNGVWPVQRLCSCRALQQSLATQHAVLKVSCCSFGPMLSSLTNLPGPSVQTMQVALQRLFFYGENTVQQFAEKS